MFLLGEHTPYNLLDMSLSSSIVTNLKECGYYTIASHPADGINYNRIISYKDMGFDEVHFISDFQNQEFYGNRHCVTDASAYQNLIRWHEKARDKGKPIFSFMLTIQNHCGYTMNESEEDLVHVKDYIGTEEMELNEYLSCIYLSDIAIKELTEYFSKQERPTVICMVGDHSINLIGNLTDVNKSKESALLARSVPFMIWANYEIDERDVGAIGMNSVVPLLLDVANVQMIPYYHYIRELTEDVPMLGGFGMIMDKDGNIHSYYDDTEYSARAWKYLGLAYNNINGEEKFKAWFHLNK